MPKNCLGCEVLVGERRKRGEFEGRRLECESASALNRTGDPCLS